MKNLLVPFLLLLLLSHCTVTEQSKGTEQSPPNTELTKKAKAYFGDHFSEKENAPKDYVIVFKKHKELRDLFATVQFFVYKKETNTIVFEDELKAGTVKWKSDYKILATSRNNNPERKAGMSSTIYYTFDVLKLEKKIQK